MKPFSIWLAVTLLVFGSFGAAYHSYLTDNPRKVLVALDTSFPMQSVWHRVPRVLETFDHRRYTEFALVTDKNRIHGWSPKLVLGTVGLYAPRDFSKLTDNASYPEIDEASEKWLVTNSEPSQTVSLSGWQITRPTP